MLVFVSNMICDPLSLKIEGEGLFRDFHLTLNKLHALIKTNQLMLYREVSTVVIS